MVRQKRNYNLDTYYKFCSNLNEGSILYNLNKTNQWGEYLLVANITSVNIAGYSTYTVLLIGLKKEDKKFIPLNLKVKLTPDYTNDIPFLKYIGHCNFSLIPECDNININTGLVAIYSTTNLKKYAHKLSLRKPKTRKYDADGRLVIRKADNK